MIGGKLLSASAAVEPTFIEDVFSTYLYTGNGSTQTITNGIDLAGEGGLVWTKRRSTLLSHQLFDTLRGVNVQLSTDVTNGNTTVTNRLNSFNVDGFTLGGGASGPNVNTETYASWTFRQAPRFFDVVVYTGDGGTARAISHDLGVAPGMVIVKRTNAAQSWHCLHKDANLLFLDTTDAAFSAATTATRFGDGTNVIRPNSTTFTVTGSTINNSGDTYVAYLFAHDPLGPSGDGSDGLIACGSFTTDGSSNATVNLGWEPQWLLVKPVQSTGFWLSFDVMRGWNVSGTNSFLAPNSSNAETSGVYGYPTATGFVISNTTPIYYANQQYIYIAIRRGPMREPTVGTEVFTPLAVPASTSTSVAAPFPPDLVFSKYRTSTTTSSWTDRLRGLAISSANNVATLRSESTAAEVAFAAHNAYYNNNRFELDSSSAGVLGYFFRRAPGFFDVVALPSPITVSGNKHNLGVTPELIIQKQRGATSVWYVIIPNQSTNNYGFLNTTASFVGNSFLVNADSTTFDSAFSGAASTINYLFATLSGISKVGSYTGNGSSQTINCAFTTGARFILIKRTDSTGDWYVWDTARGIVAGNDPHLSLNTTAAEVTTNDTIDPDNSGFIVNQVAATNVNVNAATYIYLAIA